MSTDPMQIIFDLLRKGKNSWSKDDKEKYDSDLYLRRRND